MFPALNFNRVSTLLSLAVLIETLCLTYVQEKGGVFYYSSSIVYVVSGLFISLLPLIQISVRSQPSVARWPRYLGVLILILLAIYYVNGLIPLYSYIPIDKSIADMLPSIKLACERLDRHEVVYGPAPEIWPGAIIPYLPMMWLPFMPAEVFHFDYRWITFILQGLGIYMALRPILKSDTKPPLIPGAIGVFSLFLINNFLLIKHKDYWSMTQEGLVAGFYMILCSALVRKNYVWIGLAMMACTLSRYSLLMWVPLYFGYVWLSQPRSDFWKMALTYGISMILLFVLPFFIWNPIYFFHISDNYLYLSSMFWERFQIAEHRHVNVGLFKFYSVENVTLMFRIGVFLSFLLPLLLLIWVLRRQRSGSINTRYVGFASLKICIICFFSFIPMPYFYIFVPPTLISYVVLFDYLSGARSRAIE